MLIFSPGGNVDAMRGRLGFDVADDVDGGSLAVLENRKQRAPPAVVADDVGLHRVAVAHLCDVAHIDRRIHRWSYRKAIESFHDSGVLFEWTVYSRVPILAEPVGRKRL